MTKMQKIVQAANEAGYAGVSTTGKSFKQFGCPKCRKNTAVKFIHTMESKFVMACICGWRKTGRV
jgi:hypothetical protein